MRQRALPIVLSVLFAVIGHTAFAQTFSVQGVLRDPLGKTVADGSYSLTFRLYEQATGGTAIWQETQGSVQVLHGVFGAELGTVTSLSSAPFNTTYWLGVSINNGQELAPRLKLTKSPAAMSVLGTDNVFPSKGNVGVGTASPTAELHIVGTPGVTNELLIEDADGKNHLVVTADKKVGVGVKAPEAALHIVSPSSVTDELLIKNESGSTHLRVTSDNNVGIGVDAPEAVLHIRTADDTKAKLLIEGSNGSDYVVVTQDGKMGVGVSAPNDPLSVNGNLRLQNGGAIVFDDGTSIGSANFGGAATAVTAPGNALVTADADKDNTGEVQLVTGSTTRMVVQNDGKVGIGTTSPKSMLDVKGGVAVGATYSGASAAPTNGMIIEGNVGIGTSNPGYKLDVAGNVNFTGNLYKNGSLFSAGGWSQSGSNTYYTAGNVGIGTASPTTKLHITGSTATDATLFLQPSEFNSPGDYATIILGDAGHYIRGEHTNGMQFYDYDRFSFSGGNVGIGKSNPGYKLDVTGDINFTGNLYKNGSSFGGGSQWNQSGSNIYYTAGRVGIGTSNPTQLLNVAGDVDLSGSVGIGVGYPSAKLHIKQPSAGNGIRIEDWNSGNYWQIYFPSGDDNLNFEYSGTVRAYVITYNGSWNTVSDIRLKENITDLEPVMDTLMGIGTYRFTMKGQTEPQIGFIAQDLEKHFPEFVSENKGYKGVDYARLTPVLVKAIQEQQHQIERQQAENAANVAQVEALKAENTVLKTRLVQVEAAVQKIEAMMAVNGSDRNQAGEAVAGVSSMVESR